MIIKIKTDAFKVVVEKDYYLYVWLNAPYYIKECGLDRFVYSDLLTSEYEEKTFTYFINDTLRHYEETTGQL